MLVFIATAYGMRWQRIALVPALLCRLDASEHRRRRVSPVRFSKERAQEPCNASVLSSDSASSFFSSPFSASAPGAARCRFSVPAFARTQKNPRMNPFCSLPDMETC